MPNVFTREYSYKVINPYNIVPFPGDPERRPYADYYGDPSGLLTGWVDVRAVTKTPLTIPDGARYLEADLSGDGSYSKSHKAYPFYRLPDGRFGIPGSALRGAVRSAYEAVTNSCLPFFLDDAPISQRPPFYAAFQNHGLLRYDARERKWVLEEGREYRLPCRKRDVESGAFRWERRDYRTGQTVGFHLNDKAKIDSLCPAEEAEAQGWETGILQFNVPVADSKYNVRVLVPTGRRIDAWPLRPGEDARKADIYRAIHDPLWDSVEQDGKKNPASRDLLRCLEDAPDNGARVPVYYLNTGKYTYLSNAAVGRVSRRRKWRDILGLENQGGDHRPCWDRPCRDELCPACALFGMLGGGRGDKAPGLRGRLRFTDAAAEEVPQPEKHVPPILGGPRISAYEFYFDRPRNATYWNSDYYAVKGMKKDDPAAYSGLNKATPRGRKFYFHSDSVLKDAEENGRPALGQMNNTVEALPAETVFRFRIYFDRILPGQLDRLTWLLSLGENWPGSRMWHKLGHARPLGYGSVKLLVDDVKLRTLALTPEGELAMALRTRECAHRPNKPKELCCDLSEEQRTAVRAFLRICDSTQTDGYSVEYPRGADGNIFTWFKDNRVVNKEHPVPDTLPELVKRDAKKKGGKDELYLLAGRESPRDPAPSTAPARKSERRSRPLDVSRRESFFTGKAATAIPRKFLKQ